MKRRGNELWEIKKYKSPPHLCETNNKSWSLVVGRCVYTYYDQATGEGWNVNFGDCFRGPKEAWLARQRERVDFFDDWMQHISTAWSCCALEIRGLSSYGVLKRELLLGQTSLKWTLIIRTTDRSFRTCKSVFNIDKTHLYGKYKEYVW